MKDRLENLTERFESYSLRERALISLGVIVLVFMLWDTLIMSPEEINQKRMVQEMHSINDQVNDINTQIAVMTASMEGGESAQMRKRIDELEDLLSGIRDQEENLTLDFIRPEQMAGVLRELLTREGQLTLLSLQSLGAEPLFPPSDNIPNSNSSANSASNPVAGKTTDVKQDEAQIYKHGLRVVLEGNFQSTLHFLQSIEAMPWRFYWDSVEYEVMKYPRARIAITVHTLSLEEDWIGV